MYTYTRIYQIYVRAYNTKCMHEPTVNTLEDIYEKDITSTLNQREDSHSLRNIHTYM